MALEKRRRHLEPSRVQGVGRAWSMRVLELARPPASVLGCVPLACQAVTSHTLALRTGSGQSPHHPSSSRSPGGLQAPSERNAQKSGRGALPHLSDPRLQLCGPIRDLGPTSGDQGSLSCACEVRRDGSRLWLSGEGKGWSLVEAESHQLQPRTGAEEMTAPVARKAG